MAKQLQIHPLNLHPNTLAATLSEQARFKEIAIRTDENPPGDQRQEITKTVVDSRNSTLTIYAKTQPDERQELVWELDGKSPYRGLLESFEATARQFATEVFQEERKHLLGTSELHTHFFDLPDFLNLEQRKTMACFLPWTAQIKGDLALMERCFFTAIGMPVRIKSVVPCQAKTLGITVGGWVTDLTDAIGGISKKTNPHFQVHIGPVPMDCLPRFVPGSQGRRFLEEVLLSAFFPENWHWKIVIEVEKENEKFIVPGTNGAAIIGINSRID